MPQTPSFPDIVRPASSVAGSSLKYLGSLLGALLLLNTTLFADTASPLNTTIPFSEIGAKATAEYKGDAIGIGKTSEGASLHTGFQKLSGTVTREGLRMTSTEEGGGSLHLVASAVGRGDSKVRLPAIGNVTVTDQLVTYIRPGLIEEYSVSADGVRQDFIVADRPEGSGGLRVDLRICGALAETGSSGVRLTLDGSKRELAYSRLHVIDATGRELAASLEIESSGQLSIMVDDDAAAYPVRIDPTFSDADWVSLNPELPGANGSVDAVALDGSGNLYIGGDFTLVGSVMASRIAKWNGSSWSALGDGVDNYVHALALSGTDLYAGGSFTTAGGVPASRIAKWDGSAWSAVGSGMDNTVRAIAVSGADLYAGGQFINAGGVSASRIAKWNGSDWSGLGSGMNSTVNALAVSGTDLYAGGSFTTAGGISANRIAKWNGSSWAVLGTGANSDVNALALDGSDLYVAGSFSTAGELSASRIAKWDGNSWSALGSGVGGTVSALAVSGSDVYAAGNFSTAGGAPASRIAKWNGSAWSPLSSGTGDFSNIKALVMSGGDLYAGGGFWKAGEVGARFIAKWNGSAWSALGTGTTGAVQAMAVSGTDLYIAGDFISAGGVAVNRIAKWDGSVWSGLGVGIGTFYNASVYALAVSGTDLYAGGYFQTAGGVAAMNIAKWNGSAWSALGSGITNDVRALAVIGTDLYAGGTFTTAGGMPASHIAKWDGSAWAALGSGTSGSFGSRTNGDVYALAVSGTDLYAGGSFISAGGVSASGIAKWNGSDWSALGTGIPKTIRALAVSGTDLYAAGDFTTAGGVPSNRIAKWNGNTWSALGSGISSDVTSLAVSGGDLYAGGIFTTAGGVLANCIAKWDGGSWSALGSGMGGQVNSLVNALAVIGDKLYIGGSFEFAGTKISPYIAQANLPSPVIPSVTTPTSGNITGNSATLGGNVSSDGGAMILARGVVFSPTASNNNPQIGGVNVTHITATGTTGVFTVDAGSLTPDTAYTFAAYATNSVGTSYSPTGSFTTLQTAPEIAVEQPLTSNVADGGGRNFGSVALGADVSFTFIIKNTGNADLTGLGITLEQTDSDGFDDFTITTNPTAPLPGAGGTTAFTVRYAPGSAGTKTAVIHIASNDADENPFDIGLSGTGAAALAVFNDAITTSSGLTGDNALPSAIPFNDGVENLLKYAFNMNLAGPDSSSLAAGTGTAGLPAFSLVGEGVATEIQVEYIRRKGSGLTYTPKRSSTLTPGSFVPIGGTPVVTSIDDNWERVVVQESADPETLPQSFAIVEVTIPE